MQLFLSTILEAENIVLNDVTPLESDWEVADKILGQTGALISDRVQDSVETNTTIIYPGDIFNIPGSIKCASLHQEVLELINKSAIELASSSPVFFSHLFVVPKAGAGDP